jgi:hypothetical protein
MGFSDSPQTLKIFLSYASEDFGITRALARGLRNAFPNSIEILFAGDFPSGLSWRQQINQSLNSCDILIAVATGRLKAGFSFTGYEIGFFANSLEIHPKMIHFPEYDRRMVPFAVLSAMPDTINEMEGINIDPEDLRAVRFQNEELISDPADSSPSHAKLSDSGLLKLLSELDHLVRGIQFGKAQGRPIDEVANRNANLKSIAKRTCIAVLDEMRGRAQLERHPKSKLVVRLQPTKHNDSDADVFSKSTVEMVGPCFEIFGFSESVDRPLTWAEFTSKCAAAEIKHAWREAIWSLVAAARKDAFGEDTVIISHDKKHSYRIFVTKLVRYFSTQIEIHLYIVNTLRKRTYGDPHTTILLRAAEVSLQYRFMFLEKGINFSPENLKITPLDKIKSKVLELVSELNILLNLSEDFGLNDSSTILEIMGSGNLDLISGFMNSWQIQKDNLYTSANLLLGTKKLTDLAEAKGRFVETLEEFCKETRVINEIYTAKVLGALTEAVNYRSEPVKPQRPRIDAIEGVG